MELADDVADDAGAFLVGGAGIDPKEPHRIEDAPVDGLEAVAGIRQRPVHDRREGIGEIALLQRLLEGDGLDVAASSGGRIDGLAHSARVPWRATARESLRF